MRANETSPIEASPYASQPRHSGGRLVHEPGCDSRNPWARDRDRIVHSTAFRRLNYKTQVFVYHEGDHYRSRLTHSLEVAQIARAMARRLGFHEDLTEALALAHDLGHPPFGHAGERALDRVMERYGGFDHNIQTLRVVTELERLYASFDGLNLTIEVIEGLAKHNGPVGEAGGKSQLSKSRLPPAVLELGQRAGTIWSQFGAGEAQLAAIADDIAYNAHDLDDALRARLISPEDLEATAITARYRAEIHERHGALDGERMIYEVKRRLITGLIDDAVTHAERNIEDVAPKSCAEIKSAGSALIRFSPEKWQELVALRAFLFERVYHHKNIAKMTAAAQTIVNDLFTHYDEHRNDLPEAWQKRIASRPREAQLRTIGDFVAGMTDRFAISEHGRLFDATPELR